jgi:hypothetical protein
MEETGGDVEMEMEMGGNNKDDGEKTLGSTEKAPETNLTNQQTDNGDMGIEENGRDVEMASKTGGNNKDDGEKILGSTEKAPETNMTNKQTDNGDRDMGENGKDVEMASETEGNHKDDGEKMGSTKKIPDTETNVEMQITVRKLAGNDAETNNTDKKTIRVVEETRVKAFT